MAVSSDFSDVILHCAKLDRTQKCGVAMGQNAMTKGLFSHRCIYPSFCKDGKSVPEERQVLESQLRAKEKSRGYNNHVMRLIMDGPASSQ